MPGQLEDIGRISIQVKGERPMIDPRSGDRDFTVRDQIVERIREIAGKDSIKRVAPIQHQGDHQEQDIVFDIGDDSFMATIRYNNELTEGWVTTLRKYPKIC